MDLNWVFLQLTKLLSFIFAEQTQKVFFVYASRNPRMKLVVVTLHVENNCEYCSLKHMAFIAFGDYVLFSHIWFFFIDQQVWEQRCSVKAICQDITP